MAHDSLGAYGEPQYSGLGVPADAADLSEIATYAGKVGTRIIGTTVDRNAAIGTAEVRDGMRWRDTTNGNEYEYQSGGWVQLGLATAQHFPRTSGNTSDSFSNGVMTNLVSGTIPNAAPGTYVVYAAIGLGASASGIGYVRITASNTATSTNPVPDSRRDVSTAIRNEYVQGLFVHAGGNLNVQAFAQVSNGTGTVITNGTYVGAFRVGS